MYSSSNCFALHNNVLLYIMLLCKGEHLTESRKPNIKYLQIPIVVLALLGLILISVTVTKMLKEMKHVDKMFGKKSRDVFISS